MLFAIDRPLVEPVQPTRFPAPQARQHRPDAPKELPTTQPAELDRKVISYLYHYLHNAMFTGEAFSASRIAQALHAPEYLVEETLSRLHQEGLLARDVDTIRRPPVVKGPFGAIALDGGSARPSSDWLFSDPVRWAALAP